MALLAPELTASLINVAYVVISGGVVWLVKTRQKASRAENRELTKDLVMEMIKPALMEANQELLKTMNGTYLRTAEARVHFDGIKTQLDDLKSQLSFSQSHHTSPGAFKR